MTATLIGLSQSASRRNLLKAPACFALLMLASTQSYGQLLQEAPRTAPHERDLRSTQRGETLSERLDRDKGVIHPPAGTDPGIAVPAPDPHPHTTPVIPAPGSPGGDPSVQPK